MAVTTPPVDLAQRTIAPVAPEPPITADRALQIANVLVKMEVSTQIGTATPGLVDGERSCWSVPMWLTFPDRGCVGQVGTVQVDATTGQEVAETEALREIAEHAKRLVERPAL